MRTSPEQSIATRSFPAHPSMLHEVRRFIRERAFDSHLTPPATDDLVLAVSEACANAVLHSASGMVQVNWRDEPDLIEVEVLDQGVFRRRVPVQDAG